MRVTVSHNKGREEASRIVENTMDNLLAGEVPKPFRMTPVRKQWMGSTLNFQTAVAMGPLKLPIRGVVEAKETEVVIDIDLPPLLAKFIPEQKLKEAVESRIRGHLAAPRK
jgi:hypothetical protein